MCDKNYFNLDDSSDKFTKMFEQVSRVLTSTLESLAYIYKTNGLNY